MKRYLHDLHELKISAEKWKEIKRNAVKCSKMYNNEYIYRKIASHV